MPYFLDGNNLIGRARGRARPGTEDRDALVAELCDRLRRTRARIVLFFDGGVGGPSSLGSLTIRASGPGSADDRILEEIARARAPAEITVVTADRDLARRARDAGARTISPDDFWKRFGAASSGAGPAGGPVDVEDWLGYFSDERNRG